MRKLSLLAAVFFIFVSASVYAAVITLKSGEKLNGFIVDEQPDRLVVRVSGADVDVLNDDIVSVEFIDPAKRQEYTFTDMKKRVRRVAKPDTTEKPKTVEPVPTTVK